MEVKIDYKKRITILQDAYLYTFTDSFRGLFAVAKRDISYGFKYKGKARFKLYYGNSNNYYPLDDRNDYEYARNEIINMENKYVKTEVSFDEERTNCDTRFYQKLNVFERSNDQEI